MTHRLIVKAVVSAALLSGLAYGSAAMAQVSVNIGIGVAPPAPIYEPVPVARPGYIWIPGYWDWDDHYRKHAWKKGYWERERPGYIYESPRWVQGGGGWVLVPGRWDARPGHRRDRDDWDDDDHGHKHGNRGGYHCPPGHARKGEC